MEKLFGGGLILVVSVSRLFHGFDEGLQRLAERFLRRRQFCVLFLPPFPLGARFLHTQANGASQLLAYLIDFLVGVICSLPKPHVQFSHLRVKPRLGSRLLLQQELDCPFDVHLPS